jgi:hypothetical protein
MYPEPGRYARGQTDPGEQTTGTRDEHYDLISVLYHALHGAENCEIYATDAEAAGRDELAAFFREAQAMHAALAERAKGHLGIGGTTPGDITQEGPTPGAAVGSGVLASGGAPGDVAPESAEVRRGELPVDDVPDEPPDAASPEDVPPRADRTPRTEPNQDEDVVAQTGDDVAPGAPAGGEDAAPPTGEPRRAVPPDAPRTQDPPPRMGDAPPSPSEQLRPEEERPSEEQLPRQGP